MSRLIEVASGLAATTIGLIGVGTEVRALVYPYDNAQVTAIPSGIGPSSWSAMSSQASHFMLLLAILLVGLSIGGVPQVFAFGAHYRRGRPARCPRATMQA